MNQLSFVALGPLALALAAFGCAAPVAEDVGTTGSNITDADGEQAAARAAAELEQAQAQEEYLTDLDEVDAERIKGGLGGLHTQVFGLSLGNPLAKLRDLFPKVCTPVNAFGRTLEEAKHAYFMVGVGVGGGFSNGGFANTRSRSVDLVWDLHHHEAAGFSSKSVGFAPELNIASLEAYVGIMFGSGPSGVLDAFEPNATSVGVDVSLPYFDVISVGGKAIWNGRVSGAAGKVAVSFSFGLPSPVTVSVEREEESGPFDPATRHIADVNGKLVTDDARGKYVTFRNAKELAKNIERVAPGDIGHAAAALALAIDKAGKFPSVRCP